MRKLPTKEQVKEMDSEKEPKKSGLIVIQEISKGMDKINEKDEQIKKDAEHLFCPYCGNEK